METTISKDWFNQFLRARVDASFMLLLVGGLVSVSLHLPFLIRDLFKARFTDGRITGRITLSTLFPTRASRARNQLHTLSFYQNEEYDAQLVQLQQFDYQHYNLPLTRSTKGAPTRQSVSPSAQDSHDGTIKSRPASPS